MKDVLIYVVIAFFIGAIIWYFAKDAWFLFRTPEGRAERAAARKAVVEDQARRRRPLSEVAERTAAGLACPKCGGTQFKAARKTSTKLMFGAASMLGQAHFVRCVSCGTRYRRG